MIFMLKHQLFSNSFSEFFLLVFLFYWDFRNPLSVIDKGFHVLINAKYYDVLQDFSVLSCVLMNSTEKVSKYLFKNYLLFFDFINSRRQPLNVDCLVVLLFLIRFFF